MNWPLWKRELRGRSWPRLCLKLLALALVIAAIQAIRFGIERPDRVSPPLFALGLLRIGSATSWLIFNLPGRGRFSFNPQALVSIAFYLGLAIGAATLVADRFSRRERALLREVAMAGVGPVEAAALRCLRPLLLLGFSLALFVASECLLVSWRWDTVRLHHGLERSVYELIEIRAQDPGDVIDALLVSTHGTPGLTAEIVLRGLLVMTLMVTAACLPIARWPNRPLIAFVVAVAAAFMLGAAPETLVHHLTRAVRPPAVSGPVLPHEQIDSRRTIRVGTATSPYQGSVQYSGMSLNEPFRRGEIDRLPGDLPRFFRDLTRRQRHEDLILLGGYLLPFTAWMLLWLWWAKHELFQICLRE